MCERTNPPGADEPALQPDTADETPLAEFSWSDDVIGIGYFPDEVGLPRAWAAPPVSAGRLGAPKPA
jgi:hypothetical protein